MVLDGLRGMVQAYNSLVLGPDEIKVFMHPEDLKLYEKWQDENTPYRYSMVGYFKGSRIEERESCTRGWVTFERGTQVVSCSFEFKENENEL